MPASEEELPRRARETCPCCGLQLEELHALRYVQSRTCAPPVCPAPDGWTLGSQPFVRAVLRFPTAACVEEYRRRAGEPAVRCIWLTSALSAAQRSQRVRAFARARESPVALALLARSGFGGAGAAVSCIGDGWLLRSIIGMVADRALLVCDARCGDVGYNLQFATHILAPALPSSVEEVHQLAGRAERINSARERRPIKVLCLIRPGTGDFFFVQHLQRCLCGSSTQLQMLEHEKP